MLGLYVRVLVTESREVLHGQLANLLRRVIVDAMNTCLSLPIIRRHYATVYFLLLVSTTVLYTPAHSQTDSFASVVSSADAARQAGEIPKAIEFYGKAVEQNPNWPDGWWFLGILNYDANQYAPAQQALS